ncbi:rho guanine nucleotide exchange factor 17 isoform X1 [Anolis sagrei]|uniref:rho guanine nucleotide exchange factor 17 isoform X1 n=1 Tax=Anolis sagrei TaxID=38937 RepID=UPI0035203DAF
MAERRDLLEKSSALHRSLSAKRLGRRIGPTGEEGGEGGGSREEPTPPVPVPVPEAHSPCQAPCVKAHQPSAPAILGRRSPVRAASFSVLSRNVAKTSSSSSSSSSSAPSFPVSEPSHRPVRSLSPSVRQLSLRFGEPRGSDAQDEEQQQPQARNEGRERALASASDPRPSLLAGAASSLDEPPPEAQEGRTLGKRGTCCCPEAPSPLLVSAATYEADLRGKEGLQGPSASLPSPPPPPLRSLQTLSPRSSVEASSALDWPKVNEMRKLFGESFRRPQAKGEATQEGGSGPRASPKGRDLGSGNWGFPPPPPAPQSQRGGIGMDTSLRANFVHEEHNKETPPPPPPRSCIPYPGLRGHRRAVPQGGIAQREGERPPTQAPHLQWDGFHACPASPAQPSPAGPGCVAPAPVSSTGSSPRPGEISSSSEEELLVSRPKGSQPSSLSSSLGTSEDNRWQISLERSSGSEDEEGEGLSASQKPCAQRKKDGIQGQAFRGDLSAGMEWHLKAQEDLCQYICPLPTEERTELTPAAALPCDGNPMASTEGHRLFTRGVSESSLLSTPGPLSSASPLPHVSRVSKVSIPPFVPSPSGSRSSSRYSSTETLKEEELLGGSWSGQSRSFQGGLGVFRSPSFNQSSSLARLQSQVRARPKLPLGIVKTKQELPSFENLQRCGLEAVESSKHRKSMSNPDIATETLALLNFLKSDLSELKARKKGSRANEPAEATSGSSHRYERYHHSGAGHQMAGRSQSEAQPLNRCAVGGRPTLKDLTATLRRAKSFTCSDKPQVPRRFFLQNTMKQSSSELYLSTLQSTNDYNDGVSETGRDREGDGLPVIIQDQYIQEARQVFEKISKIGSQHDYNFASDPKDRSNVKAGEGDTEMQKKDALEDGCEQCLKKVDSEGNLSCGKSLEELSGPESSMTDEGIVTEVETGPPYSYLNPSVEAWKAANQRRGSQTSQLETNEALLQSHPTRPNNEKDETLPNNKMAPQGLLEAPLTPSALRRRRKFPSVGNNGSESSNGSNGEPNGETYRSLSDPMPHRRCSITEDSKNFSVDSNLLGSLNAKTGIPESSAVALSECAGSAASDLSVCSDGVKDYNTVIQNIVSQPGAMDKVIDEKGNGKTIKKKSFSDPSRRGELASAGFDGPGEPISEMEQSIPPSSSEPILSEQRDQLREQEVGRLGSLSEHVLPPQSDDEMVGETKNYSFDPKLVDVLSPRIVRRSSKKRTNRVNGQEHRNEESPETSSITPALSRARPSSKHVRHTSEPTTFIPIGDTTSPPASSNQNLHGGPPPGLSRLPLKPYPVLQAPSLEDVTKHYMLTLNSGEPSSAGTVDTPRSSPATPTASEPKLPRCPKHHEDPGTGVSRSKPQVDMRKHVIMTLLDTEQSYVESLRTLMQGYMKPLKQPENSILCDPSLVDEIFDQIPELLEHHEEFLDQISECVQNWHEKQKVGDILVQSFSKDILVHIYSAYIDNFLNAKDAVRIAKEAKPAFMKFLEQSMRENKEKQALSDLMIKPVQRIPRYELLVKDLLKHTPEEHPDHPFLLEAQRSIKQVAERINKGMKSAEEVERNARIVQEIESHIEGMEDVGLLGEGCVHPHKVSSSQRWNTKVSPTDLNPQLQAPLRRFLRQEMVVEVKAIGGKKDRSLFLFTDLLVCTTLKRKSGSLRRSSMSLYTAASVIDTASKYKLLWKLPLEDVDIVKGASQSTNRESIQKAICRLDEDLSTLGQVSKLSETLSFPHQGLDDVLKDLMASIHRELAEKQSLSFTMSFPPNKMELTATKADGTESYIFEFPNPDARHSFEQAFEDTKKKLASNKNCLDPEFLKAIPIMKTRSGMQFSCASPSHSSPENAYEVWVCNSDGYVGQVCLLSIRKEPIVEACIAVCSARILCIASVPGLKRTYRERPTSLTSPSSEPVQVANLEEPGPQQCLHISISGSSLELSEPMDSTNRDLVPFDSDDTDDESSPSPSGTLQSQASHSTISSSFGNEEIPSSKDATAETTSSEEEQDPGAFLPLSSACAQNRNSESPMDGRAMRRSSRGSFTRGSLEDLLSTDPEAYQSSMWLGTEDGCIHVYQSSDNIRNRKNSMKMQHSASVTCILYLDNQVFVSLANGELIAYQREAGRFWDAQNSKSLSLGSPGSPVTKMVAVSGKLWCGCQNRVIILNTSILQQEHTFQVGQDTNRSVTCLVSSSVGVWVTLQGSAQVRLYHSVSYDQLAEVDITPPVHKMLAGSDAIIRQHKAACLRITALLACKDLLWIGTSAGVVLTLSITANATSLKTPPLPVGLSQGHTGHVRFLTSIELPEGFDVLFPLPRDPGTEKSNDLEKRDSVRHRPSKSKMLVISGGDGYEDFRLTNSSETVGRDDSTNHLLLWRV